LAIEGIYASQVFRGCALGLVEYEGREDAKARFPVFMGLDDKVPGL